MSHAQLPQAKLQVALAALQAGRPVEAERQLRRLLRAAPEHAEVLHCLGIALHAQRQNAQALGFIERSLRLAPRNSQAENNRATVLNALGRPEDALVALERAIALRPDDPTLRYNRGNTLMALQRNTEALAAFDVAIGLDGNFRQAWQNRGITLTRLGHLTEALANYEKLISLTGARDEIMSEAQANRAWALDRLNRRDEALSACDAAIESDPDYALAHFNAAPICLAMGDYARGWREFEWRWKDPEFARHKRDWKQPLWLGEADLRGKRIILFAEQGFGDTIQFCRYVPMVKALGAYVILEAPPPLMPLLRGLSGWDELVAFGEKLPPADFTTPLMSLPLCFDTRVETIPAAMPYLTADPVRLAAWDVLLGAKTGPRIGVAWSGNPALKSDAVRSAPLADLAGLVVPGFSYYSVQKDMREADRAAATQLGVRDFGAQLKDFADTAALISLMDVVISVDSAPAHLAGALGKPVWLLLYHAAEWRWLMHRTDSPWYPSATLFRQEIAQDWVELAARVGAALAARA